jgi:hypothetical protein
VGDAALDRLFTGFGFVFGPMLVLVLLSALATVCWIIASFFDKIREGFAMSALLRRPMAVSPSNQIAREEILRLRALDDIARRERVRQTRADIAMRGRRPDVLASQLAPEVISKGQTNEIDCTDEVFNEGRKYLICRNPLENPEFFHSILRGHFTERGPRDVRYTWTCVRSLGRRFGLAEARSAVETLPGRKNLFVVPLEPDASTVALANLRTAEKKVLDSVIQTVRTTGTENLQET